MCPLTFVSIHVEVVRSREDGNERGKEGGSVLLVHLITGEGKGEGKRVTEGRCLSVETHTHSLSYFDQHTNPNRQW